jgi:ribosome-binding factor A
LDPYRHERISESIREELDELIAFEMSDPRIGSATVTEVLVSKDYRKAVVRLALVGTAQEQTETLAGLNHAKQFLRHELTERLQLFKSPELLFEAALATDLAAKAAKILKRIERGRPKDSGSEKNPIS